MKLQLMLLFGLFTTLFSCQEKESAPTLVLIPEDYVGEVIIVFGFEDGEDEKMEGDDRILQIGEDGILKTKFKASYGVSLDNFLSVSETGQRRLIRREIEVDDPNEKCIYNGSSSRKEIDGKEYELQVFVVCLKKDIDSYNDIQLKLD
ncbi:MAG: hypothetical protein AB8B56_10045 [Crocinitomicaceae bacterium]